ncbi:MAG: polysaccharide deacetylase family protein [Clostridiaceae bacterium]|nr:polysaccharide deacetylase family protein [Clostridiaceae bacterium]
MIKYFRKATRKTACLFFALILVLGTFNISNAISGEQVLYTTSVTVDGKKAEIDLTLVDTNLYVSAEKIYTLLGARYSWDSVNSHAIIQYGAKSFTISEQANEININGRLVPLISKPFIKNNALMIPLISAVESVGGGLEWEEASKTWKVYSRNLLEDTVDRMGDGTPIKEKLAKFEKYFEDGNYIFWSSLRDGASLYRSDSDGSHSGRIIDTATEVIGMDIDHVYFIDISQGNYLYKIKKDGTDLKKLSDESVESAWFEEDRICFNSKSTGLSLYSVSKDGSGKREEQSEIIVMDEDWVVNGNVSVSDKNILLKGDLIINKSGSLTLNNVNLVIDCGDVSATPVERRIEAESSSITIQNSRISSTHPEGGINFSAASSKVKIESSRISGMKEQMQLLQCDSPKLTNNYIIDSAGNGVLQSDRSKNLFFKDNVVINKTRGAVPFITLQLVGTQDTGIADNVFVDQGECIFFTQQTTGSAAVNNLIFGDDEMLCLSLRHEAGNNTFYNNFIQLNYDDGYRITDGLYSIGILSDTLDATSVFEKNVINNAVKAISIQNLKNCIYDSNRVWLQLIDNRNDRTGNMCLDMRYSHHCEFINNTFTSWLGENGSGLQLFYSTDNRIEGNSIKGLKYGLELWNASDSNFLSHNHITDCSSYIVIDRSNLNKATQNSFVSNKKVKIYAYNNGENEWSSNFYSNSSAQEAHTLYGTGSDKTPLSRANEPIIAQREFSTQKFIPYDPNDSNKGNHYVYDSETWKDEIIDWDWHYMRVMDGGTLTIENTVVKAPVSYNSEPELTVERGGTLILKNSMIMADPFGMPFHISVSDGAIIVAENCTFEFMPSFEIMSSGAAINNCTFNNCYGIDFYNSPNLTVQDCKISNSFFGLSIGDTNSSNINRNEEENISIKLGHPVQEPVAVENKNTGKEKGKNQKFAYITIDDGPSRSITPINLDTLKKYNVKATFFVLPRKDLDDIYKRIIDEGHVIGNHSYSHDYDYLYNSLENFKNDVLKAGNFISNKLNYTTTVYRFPGGSMSRSKNVIKARTEILANLGYKYFDWNVSMADTDPNLKKYGTEEQIVNLLANNILKNTKGKNKLVILMHDSEGKKYSAKALPIIIEGLRKQGYEFDVLTNY